MRRCEGCKGNYPAESMTQGFCLCCKAEITDRIKGVKHDTDKRQWHLLPWRAIDSVVAVLDYGAKKYEPENWRRVDRWSQRYFDAAVRHLVAWRQGEKNDEESGLPHLAHAACCVLFMLALDQADGG